jgi:hypothetical protein
VTSDIYGRAGRLFLVLAEAAASDATAAELAGQASARRLADHRRLAGLLAPDASPAQLDLRTDTIWVLAGPAVYVDLVHRRHWPPPSTPPGSPASSTTPPGSPAAAPAQRR